MSAAAAATHDFLVVGIGSERFALPARCVRCVLDEKALVPVCTAPRSMLGIIETSAGPAPVVDVRRRLELESAGDVGSYLIVVETGSPLLPVQAFPASWVDYLTGLTEVKIAALPPLARPRAAPLSGLLHQRGGLLLVLDAERLLEPHERELVYAALQEDRSRA